MRHRLRRIRDKAPVPRVAPNPQSPPPRPPARPASMLRGILTVGGWTHGEPRPGLRPRHADRGAARRRAGGGRVLRRADRLPNLFRRLFGEGAFNAAFVPAFSGLLAAEGRAAARQFAERGLRACMAFWLGVLTIAGEIFMPQVMSVPRARLRRDAGEIRAGGHAVAHHLPLSAADLPGGAGLRRAERAGPVHRRVGLLRAVQRGLDRLRCSG